MNENQDCEKVCTKCRESKPLSMFCVNRYWCKACSAQYQNSYILKWKQKPENKIKLQARWKISNGIYRGLIVKPTICSNCNQERKLHAHHADYTKPLEVDWLCRACHLELHGKTLLAAVS